MSDPKKLQPEDYYFLPDGRMVFTREYHLKRGYCCKSNCLHCPYGFRENGGNPSDTPIKAPQQKSTDPRKK